MPPNAPRGCASCGAQLPEHDSGAAAAGQSPLYCSSACRQRAYRRRLKAANVVSNGDRPGARRAGLPLSLDSFVGRKQELATIGRLLRHGRLITLFGPAGSGKTRLGLEVARRVSRSFSGGVHLVELGAITRPEFMVQAVAAAMGVSEQPGIALVDTLVASLQDEELLLILDNCEHLIEACGELVVSLLRRCAALHILATSREALRLPGELVFSSGALPLDDAVALFADRAQAVAPTFVLDAGSRKLVELICQRLDNLPLAIELAARRVRLFPLTDIVAGLRYRFELLTSGTRGSDSRHRDLLTAIEWSYELLSPTEQAVFRRLSMLPGGFGLDLATAVCADLDLSMRDSVELLSSLESKSLVASTAGPKGHARFRQLESVREYAQRRLVEAGEWEATAERLVAWLTRVATPLLDRFLTTGDVRDRLDAEYDNMLHAVEHLAGGTDPRQLLLVAVTVRCRDSSGIVDYGRKRLASVLRVGDAPYEYRCFALEQATWLSARHGDHDEALAMAQEAAELAREHCGTALLCRTLSALAYAHQLRGELAEAIDCFTACLEHVRGLEQPGSTALCLNNLAWAMVLAGDLSHAAALVDEALAIYAEEGEPARTAACCHTAGLLALEQGNLDSAEHEFAESLRLSGSGGSGVTPFALEGLGLAAIRGGRPERGLRLVGSAETIRRKSGQAGDPWWRERVAVAIAGARDMLRDARVDTALTEGRRSTPQSAVDYALHDRWTQPAAPAVPLTGRERDVAALVAQGLTNRQIGERLHISERTVETHLDHIRTRLDLRSRAQVAAWAAKNAITIRSSSA
jgi:predicted ATPase/DNA-binding CsgD family transcriptional regulator